MKQDGLSLSVGARARSIRLALVAILVGTVLGLGIAVASPLFAILGLLGLAAVVSIFVRPELGVLG